MKQLIESLSKTVQEAGYAKWWVEHGKKHPRFYFSNGEESRFVVFSGTADYDIPENSQNALRDLRKEMKNLEVKMQEVNGHVQTAIEAERQYPMRPYIFGRGVFAVAVSKDALSLMGDKQNARIIMTNMRHLGLVFERTQGKPPSHATNASSGLLTYHFGRNEVPFQYSESAVSMREIPAMFCTIKGDSLVSTVPIPDALLNTIKSFTLKDGALLRDKLNAWLSWAHKQGHEPSVTFKDQQVQILITEKTMKEL